MFAPVERLIAGRYLRPRREEGFISVIATFSLLGIALGVGTLIVVLAVMSGFRAELLGRVLGLNGHITLRAGPQGMADFDQLADRLRAADDVVTVTPLVTGQVMVTAHGLASGALVRGIRPEDLAAREAIAGHLQAGSVARLSDDQIAIGSRMAYRMALGLGDRLTLISPNGTPTAFGTVPRMKAYEIGAIFEVGMFEYDNTLVLMPFEAAQLYFQLEERANELEVMVADPDRVAAYRRALLPLVGDAGQLVDWQQANASFFTALKVERNVMFLILSLIIMVAAFNIISGMIMLVRSKGRDIAILRTMGATRGAVMRVFFLSGAGIGVTGTIAGFLLGLGFAANIETIRQWLQALTGTELFSAEIYFLSHLPARIEVDDVLSVLLMSLALSLLATLYPSWRAARLDPVEALRYE
ncbi:MAG TPA: lipoprotein-releasing ABC transporter permease subunit [Geminicoccaceae bacterium]|nr:lipoprotein-releasing ABC transporter permease subunit [Geminicoccaceae bacterium]